VLFLRDICTGVLRGQTRDIFTFTFRLPFHNAGLIIMRTLTKVQQQPSASDENSVGYILHQTGLKPSHTTETRYENGRLSLLAGRQGLTDQLRSSEDLVEKTKKENSLLASRLRRLRNILDACLRSLLHFGIRGCSTTIRC